MTVREKIAEEYRLDDHGIIRDPGKFKGEMYYVPHYWNVFLDGGADEEDEHGRVSFLLKESDYEDCPELRGQHWLRLIKRPDGFVVEC